MVGNYRFFLHSYTHNQVYLLSLWPVFKELFYSWYIISQVWISLSLYPIPSSPIKPHWCSTDFSFITEKLINSYRCLKQKGCMNSSQHPGKTKLLFIVVMLERVLCFTFDVFFWNFKILFLCLKKMNNLHYNV